MSQFSLPMGDRHGLSPRRRTCRQECLWKKNKWSATEHKASAACLVLGCSVPQPSLSGWKCRTDEPPPMVMSWAQSSTGFSNTSRTRRALNGLHRECLRKKEILNKILQSSLKNKQRKSFSSPFYYGVIWTHAGGQQVVPVV